MELEIVLREILKNTFKNSEIPDDITALCMGDIEEWDSLGVLSIVSMMDDLNISVNLEDLEEIKTVEDFVKLTGIVND